MANLKYFVVRTGEGELQIFYGRERPDKIPEDADEVVLRYVPLDWEIRYSSDDEESAEKKLKEELEMEKKLKEELKKLHDQTAGSEKP